MNRNLIIGTVTASVLAVVALLSFHLHLSGKEEALAHFQEHQLAHAIHIAGQIEFFLNARARELESFSLMGSLHSEDPKKRLGDIKAYSILMEKVYVRAISFHDEAGKVVHSSQQNWVGSNHGESEFFTWLRKKENREKVWVGLLLPGMAGGLNALLQRMTPQGGYQFKHPSLMLFLALPLYLRAAPGKNPGQTEAFRGVLSSVIDLRDFLLHQLHFIDPEMNLHQVWIMDQEGRVLFQSEHPNMVMRNIYQKDESCKQCHLSFAYAEKILKGKKGTVDYEGKTFPKKLAAFAPVKFGNLSWIVVVNSPYEEVTAFARRSLRDTLMLH